MDQQNNRSISTMDPGSNNISQGKDDLHQVKDDLMQRNSYSDSPLHAGGQMVGQSGVSTQSKLAQLAQEDAERSASQMNGMNGVNGGMPMQSSIQEI